MNDRNRLIQVHMQQRALQGAPAVVDVNVVCPECGQTTRASAEITDSVTEDGAMCIQRCAWCRKHYEIHIATSARTRKKV